MDEMSLNFTKELISFIESSPDQFHAVKNISSILNQNGFIRLCEGAEWKLTEGGKYYVTRNMSSIIAFKIPKYANAFMICASHTDSPTFKLKSNCEAISDKYTRLNTECYGGMILSSWFDRPLSVSGRVMVRRNGKIVPEYVNIDRDLLIIPNVAIHLNRSINDGCKYNPATDTLPLFKCGGGETSIYDIAAQNIGVDRTELLDSDLYLYNRTHGAVMGADNEFFGSPRIDNIMCAYSSFTGFISANPIEKTIPLWCSFDNEETGSATKQGAASPFLYDTMSRICECFGLDLRCALPSSFMVSADNCHARHPNHPELSDNMNAPVLNGGVVIKYNASQRYTTDSLSAAIFSEICHKANVPVQKYCNRSDIPGGSTLGGISNTKVALNTVDIGLAQLAMHSAYETAGCADALYLVKAIETLYTTILEYDNEDSYTLKYCL